MAGAYFNGLCSQAHALSVGNAKTIYQITAPSATPMRVPKINVTGDGTSGTAEKMLVEVIRGATGGTGTNVTVPAKNGNNPTSTTGPTAKENFSVEPTGGTVVHREPLSPYGSFPVNCGPALISPGETYAIRITGGSAANVTVNMPDIEV